MLSFWSPACLYFWKSKLLLLLRMVKWVRIMWLNHTALCSCHGSEKTLVNAVVKTQWVVPHSLTQPDSRIQQRDWPTALSGSSAVGI